MQDFEKLGVFYLGKRRDLTSGKTSDELILYDSRDLTTHAVVVGMTGSGKTGLCVTMLEEAALDRIPAIVIDPKGDLSNLLLTFPDLKAEDFRPWIDESQANRAGLTPDQFAAAEAQKWKTGLADWGQDGNRIRALRDAVEMRIYTPGSNAGRPLAILKSFAAPPPEVRGDADLFRERISGAASGLLALVGIDADPIRSREHILISKILELAWSAGKDLDLARLINEIQTPSFQRVGVLEIDAFFAPGDRVALSLSLNNLLASPTFASWMQGESLDVKRLLHTADGKPCISIMSISHLSETQRMFFVTILLNEVLSWVRSQAGTSSLRAILYMDEVFGYFPPTANPPAKQPMLTLLKQARAYGLGIILATQNPVDLDYKGLSNTGTWFLGRLQTERDKLRVIEGLEGASAQAGATFDRSQMEATLAGLESRVFLMNNVHEDQPVVFETRWAMSYLCGPLTRDRIQQLTQSGGGGSAPATSPSTLPAGPEDAPRVEAPPVSLTPIVDGQQAIPKDVIQVFAPLTKRLGSADRLVYHPALLAQTKLYFSKSACNVDTWLPRNLLVEAPSDDRPDDVWATAVLLEPLPEFSKDAEPNAQLAAVPGKMQRSKQYAEWEKQLKDYLFREQELVIWSCQDLKLCSQPGETEGDFRVRLEQLASERRDLEVEKLRQKYAPKFQQIQDRSRRADDRIEREKEEYQQKRLDSILHVGSTIFGALLGRKKFSATNVSKASTSMRSFGRAASQRGDINRAEESRESLSERSVDLQAEFNAELRALGDKLKVADLKFEEIRIRPRKTDIQVQKFGVAWLPYIVDSTGIGLPAYR